MPTLGFPPAPSGTSTTGAPAYLSVFTSLPGGMAGAVDSLRFDRLALTARRLFPKLNTAVSNDYLTELLVAAEADLSQRLRVWFQPREVIPDTADPSERVALEAQGKIVETEPGYDYDPDLFQGERWGLFELRQRPVIAVRKMEFAYPQPTSSLYTIPTEWVRLDGKYGRFNLVPNNASLMIPLNAFLLSAVGGGRTVPFMVQIRYAAGIANIQRDYPNLLELIKRATVLRLIDGLYLPQSGSTSADGLSQSLSWDADKYRDAIETQVQQLRERIHGINMVVM